MEFGSSTSHSQGSSIIHILNRINPSFHVETYLRSILILLFHLHPSLPRSLLPVTHVYLSVKILKGLQSFYSDYMPYILQTSWFDKSESSLRIYIK